VDPPNVTTPPGEEVDCCNVTTEGLALPFEGAESTAVALDATDCCEDSVV